MLAFAVNLTTRLLILRINISLCFIAGILSSFPLWTAERDFPIASLLNVGTPAWIHFLLLAILLGFLVMVFFSNKAWIYSVIVISVTVTVILDQLRLQPWVYIYLIMLLPFAVLQKKECDIIFCHQLAIPAIYIWSGVHKLNHNFIEGTYSDMLFIFFNLTDLKTGEVARILGYGLPMMEIGLGLGLFFAKTRNLMVWIATAMHLIIIMYLLNKTGYTNSVIIPWNIAMIVIDLLIFYRVPFNSMVPTLRLREKIAYGVVVVFIWIMPALNFFGYWDHYPSFSLYSDKTPAFYVAVHDDEISKVDEKLRNFFVAFPGLTGGRIIDVNQWAMSELNVPIYPETRIFKAISPFFCGWGIAKDKVIFFEIRPSLTGDPDVISFPCNEDK